MRALHNSDFSLDYSSMTFREVPVTFHRPDIEKLNSEKSVSKLIPGQQCPVRNLHVSL